MCKTQDEREPVIQKKPLVGHNPGNFGGEHCGDAQRDPRCGKSGSRVVVGCNDVRPLDLRVFQPFVMNGWSKLSGQGESVVMHRTPSSGKLGKEAFEYHEVDGGVMGKRHDVIIFN